MRRRRLVMVLDVIGVALLIAAAALVTPALGLAVAGLGCIGLAAASEYRPRREPAE